MPQLTQAGALSAAFLHPPIPPDGLPPPPPAVRGMPAEVDLGHWGSPAVIIEVDTYPRKPLHFQTTILFGEGIGEEDCIMYWMGRKFYAIAGGEGE